MIAALILPKKDQEVAAQKEGHHAFFPLNVIVMILKNGLNVLIHAMDVKNYIIMLRKITLVILILTQVSCVEQDLGSTEKFNAKDRSSENMLNFFIQQNLNEYVDGKNAVDYILTAVDRDDEDLQLWVNTEIKSRNLSPDNWSIIDIANSKYFSQNLIDPLQFNPRFDSSIQSAALITAHRLGLNSLKSNERDDMIIKYLNILLAQKSIDVLALVELVQEIKNSLDIEEFERIKSYINETAHHVINLSEAELIELREDINNGNSSIQIKSSIAHQIDKYLSSKEAILILETM